MIWSNFYHFFLRWEYNSLFQIFQIKKGNLEQTEIIDELVILRRLYHNIL